MSTLKEDLKVLAKMTKALNELPHYTSPIGIVEYKVDHGTCYVKKLFENASTTILWSFISDGTKFFPHEHSSNETFVVYRGSLEIWAGNEKLTTLKAISTYQLAPNIEHYVKAIGDTEVCVVLVPPEEKYPDGE